MDNKYIRKPVEKKLLPEEKKLLNLIRLSLIDKKINNIKLKNLNNDNEVIELAKNQGVLSYIISFMDQKNNLSNQNKKLEIMKLMFKARQKKMLEELCKISKKLDEYDICPLILKGFIFLNQYPESLMRSFGDLDLQLTTEEIPIVHKTLIELGYEIYYDKKLIEPDKALQKFYKKETGSHMYPYIKNNGNFKSVVEIHPSDFSIFGVSTEPMLEQSTKYKIKDEIEVLGYKIEDLFIFSCLNYARDNFGIAGQTNQEGTLSDLLDVCILAKQINKKGKWQKVLDRCSELKAYENVYHAVIRGKYFIEEFFPDFILQKIESKLSQHLISRHIPFIKNKNYESNFWEWKFRYEESEKKYKRKMNYMRNNNLLGKVICSYGNNPKKILEKHNKEPEILKLDPYNIPEWNIHSTVITRVTHPKELMKLKSAFAWDKNNFYCFIHIFENHLENLSVGFKKSKVGIDFYENNFRILAIEFYPKRANNVKYIFKNDKQKVEEEKVKGKWKETRKGYTYKIKIPWNYLMERFSFKIPQKNEKLGFNIRIQGIKEDNNWYRMDWGISYAYGVMIFQ